MGWWSCFDEVMKLLCLAEVSVLLTLQMMCCTRRWATVSSFCRALFPQPSPASPGRMAATSPSSGTAPTLSTWLTTTVNTKVSVRKENKNGKIKGKKVNFRWLTRWCLPPIQPSSPHHTPTCVLFPGLSVLNTITAALNISKLTPEHTANYSVYVNEDIYCGNVTLVVIGEWDNWRHVTSRLFLALPAASLCVSSAAAVPVPSISYMCENKSCELTCDGDTSGAKPVTYTWRSGEKELPNGTSMKLQITKVLLLLLLRVLWCQAHQSWQDDL